MSTLQYSDYEFEKYGYMQPKPPALNGGLYTGEKFNGPHGNVPVQADAEYLITKNLASANPPIEGRFHYPGYTRPGNNKQNLPGTRQYSNIHHFRCLSNKELLKYKNNGMNGVNGSGSANGSGNGNNVVPNTEKFTNQYEHF